MRALTVQQPWASAMFWDDPKDVENRTKNVAGAHRGSLAIHAGQRWSVDGALSPLIRSHQEYDPSVPALFGVIVGVVDLVNVHLAYTCRGKCSRWAEDSGHHLELAKPRLLLEPIEAVGKLGLWTVPSDVFVEVRRQLMAAVRAPHLPPPP